MGLFSRRSVPTGSGNPNADSRRIEDGLVAAGARVDRRNSEQMRRLIQPWQSRAFSYYDQVGELWYAAQFYARMMSLLRLYPAELDAAGDWVETTNPAAVAALERIQDPGGGREDFLTAYGRLMFIAGEGYLLCSVDRDTGLEQWEMLSTDELRIQSGVYVRYRAPSLAAEELHEPTDDEFVPVGDEAVAYRLWRRHPRFSSMADSPMKGILDLAEELILLTRAVRARARSRVAGSGILAISEDFSHNPREAVPDDDIDLDPFLADLRDAMLAGMANEGAPSQVVPVLLRGPTAAIKDGIRHIQIVDPTQLYPETGLRYEIIKRMAIGLDLPPEILLGLADSNHWPCDETTEVFTADRGFVTHDQLDAGDIVLSLNHDTGQSEWVPLSGVRREHVEDVEMVRVLTPSVDALTTPQHRWPVLRDGERVWTDGAGLLPDDRIIRAVPHAALPADPIHSDAFVKLVAWYVTEGTCTWPSAKHCQVRIGQSHVANLDNVESIRRVLTDLYGPALPSLARGPGVSRGTAVPPAWREDAEPRGMTLFHLNKSAYAPLLDTMESERTKVVSREFVYSLTQEQLTLFLETLALGDGALSDQGGVSINQRAPERLEPLALAAILAGRPVKFTTQTRRGGFSDGVQHYLNVPATRGHDVPVGETSRERYTGVIFCPKVPPTKSFLARRNGSVYFTGNTGWLVDETTWKAHGQPASNQLVNDLTGSYFRPQLRADGVTDWERYAIAYDASAIVNHPDRASDAQKLYDRRAIGKQALRDAGGFDEEDAPTEDELNEMIGVAVRDGSLALWGIPSVKAGGIETDPGEIVTATGTEAAVAGETSGAAVEAGPAKDPGDTPDDASLMGAALNAAKIAGAAELALLRAREVAGSRLRSMAKKDPDVLALIDGVPNRGVAARLGADAVRGLGENERDLVARARGVLEDALRMWGLDDATTAVLVEQIELHAARTLYDERPSPLPPQFRSYVVGVLARA